MSRSAAESSIVTVSQYVAMLREGLAAEFPFAARALASIPRRFVVSREDPRWAAVSAFGVAWLVAAAGNAVATLSRVAGFRETATWVTAGFLIAGAALGIAVAIRAGGRRGVLWYAVGLAANAVFVLVAELPFYVQTCARLGGAQDCSPLRLVLPQIYILAGVPMSIAAARVVISGPTGTNPILAAAGAVVLSQTALFGLWRLTATPTGDPIVNLGISLGFVASGMLAAGAIIRRRATGSRPLITFAIIATILWLSGQWPFIWGIVNGAYVVNGVLVLYPIVIGPVELAALFLGWMLLLPGADDRGGLVQVGSGVKADEEDPAPSG